jgi:adenosylhomocysteine nucleosidase
MLLLRMTATIGLIAAMKMEARPVLRLLGPWERFALRGFPAYRFTSRGTDCVLVESGAGMENAETAAHALLSAVEPLCLVSFGIAGAVEREVRVGDVIAASRASFLENGLPGRTCALAPLPEAARRGAERALETCGARLYAGSAITTRGEQPTLAQLQGFAHPLLDMETAGIARAAGEWGTPLFSLRSMSDTPDEPLPIAIEELMDAEHALRLANIAGICLRHPSTVSRLLRFGRNAVKAAENAAVAVAAILEYPFPTGGYP